MRKSRRAGSREVSLIYSSKANETEKKGLLASKSTSMFDMNEEGFGIQR